MILILWVTLCLTLLHVSPLPAPPVRPVSWCRYPYLLWRSPCFTAGLIPQLFPAFAYRKEHKTWSVFNLLSIDIILHRSFLLITLGQILPLHTPAYILLSISNLSGASTQSLERDRNYHAGSPELRWTTYRFTRYMRATHPWVPSASPILVQLHQWPFFRCYLTMSVARNHTTSTRVEMAQVS